MLRRVAAAMAICGVVLTAPAPTSGRVCPDPTFNEIVREASVIVDGRLIVVEERPPWPDQYTIEVRRVLRGDASRTIEVSNPATACGGAIGDFIDIGDRLILAVGVESIGSRVAPFWQMRRGQLDGTAGIPDGATTLDDIAALIGRLPDTSTERAAVNTLGAVWPPLLVGVLALALFLARPLSRRRRPR